MRNIEPTGYRQKLKVHVQCYYSMFLLPGKKPGSKGIVIV